MTIRVVLGEDNVRARDGIDRASRSRKTLGS